MIGLGFAWVLAGVARAFLFGITPHYALFWRRDLVPDRRGGGRQVSAARRAAAIDPVVALRAE